MSKSSALQFFTKQEQQLAKLPIQLTSILPINASNHVIASPTLKPSTRKQYYAVVSNFLSQTPLPPSGKFTIQTVYSFSQNKLAQGRTRLAANFSLIIHYLLEEAKLVTRNTDTSLLTTRYANSLRKLERNRQVLKAQPLVVHLLQTLEPLLALYAKLLIALGCRWATILKQTVNTSEVMKIAGQWCRLYNFPSPDNKSFIEAKPIVLCDCAVSRLKGNPQLCLVHGINIIPLKQVFLNKLCRQLRVTTYFSRRSGTILAAAVIKTFSFKENLFNFHFGWSKNSKQIVNYAKDWPKHTELIRFAGIYYAKLGWLYSIMQGQKISPATTTLISKLERSFKGLWDTENFNLPSWNEQQQALPSSSTPTPFFSLPKNNQTKPLKRTNKISPEAEELHILSQKLSLLEPSASSSQSNPVFTPQFFHQNIKRWNSTASKKSLPKKQLPQAASAQLEFLAPLPLRNLISMTPSYEEALLVQLPFFANLDSNPLKWFTLRDTVTPLEAAHILRIFSKQRLPWAQRIQELNKLRKA